MARRTANEVWAVGVCPNGHPEMFTIGGQPEHCARCGGGVLEPIAATTTEIDVSRDRRGVPVETIAPRGSHTVIIAATGIAALIDGGRR